MPRFPAVILAGGRSRRMGVPDKGLLPLGEKPVIAHVIAALALQTSSLAINSGNDPEKYSAFDLPVLADIVPGFQGPLAGVLTAMTWARTLGATHVFTAPCDMPFLPSDLAQRLAARLGSDTDIVIATCAGDLHPLTALWPVTLAARLEEHLRHSDSRGVLEWLAQCRVAHAEFTNAGQFLNLNSPDDLVRAAQSAPGARVRTE